MAKKKKEEQSKIVCVWNNCKANGKEVFLPRKYLVVVSMKDPEALKTKGIRFYVCGRHKKKMISVFNDALQEQVKRGYSGVEVA